ncbi:hypothetical protein [Inhella gelatinilytica]|uniref:Lipoprotein n=1 Tax=Inhella gelatinilytica TaxID=2795030 RepID=A0A931IX27_9BURK|nr:hypothetical protein [Inhella gelatinilytica]MBH9552644.1 hypothetical protein [Inhella gelatinilytica]
MTPLFGITRAALALAASAALTGCVVLPYRYAQSDRYDPYPRPEVRVVIPAPVLVVPHPHRRWWQRRHPR